jgi:hypothetical protein
MIGQGRPTQYFRALLPIAALLCAYHGVSAPPKVSAADSRAAETTLQLRFAWGGGTPLQWSGAISISEGTIELNRPLGIERDEPGSMWVERNRLRIQTPSTRAFDGVDLFVTASLDARLSIQLLPAGGQRAVTSEVPLRDLLQKPLSRSLDDRGNRLLVRRAPGDMLRVRTDHDALVFSPGDTLLLDVKPHLLPLSEGANVRLKARLIAKQSGEEQWSQEFALTNSASGPTTPAIVTLEQALPNIEGVYDLILEASERNPLRWSKAIAMRQVQLVIIGDNAPSATADGGAPWTRTLELDPANPGWADRMKSLLPNWRQGALGSGQTQPSQHPLGPIVQLSGAVDRQSAAWETYPLAIANPNAPHVLEVDYPSDVPQSLGISILEPNAAGVIGVGGLDSGVYVDDDTVQLPPKWARHRILFWPRTKSPLVLITNHRLSSPAAFGKIRVYQGPSKLIPAYHPAFDQSERLFAAYLNRPLFNENFSANESLDSYSGRSLDDWQTFLEGTTRLVEYLQHTGHNGLMLAVLADGSSIYPSALSQPTPLYDNGAFFDQGQDPYRKDALELMLRVFDRERMRLVPSLQFEAPLPQLEAIRRAATPEVDGVELVGSNGQTWSDQDRADAHRGPYYNPLNPRVQEAMLAVVGELLKRYADHPSFSGVALELSPETYTHLPGDLWGLDDATIAQFERETKVRIPHHGPDRFAARAAFLSGEGRSAWLGWRAKILSGFYTRIRDQITRVRPDAVLYLAPVQIFNLPDARRQLRPALTGGAKPGDVLLGLGIDVRQLGQVEGLVLLRGHTIAPPAPLAASGVDLELDRSLELDHHTENARVAGSLFFHSPDKVRLQSAESKSPFGKERTLWSQMSPGGVWNRRRFVHSLARLDSEAIFDGGWMLPLGQEESIADFIASYRRLPAGRFQTMPGGEPVTARTLVRDKRTYAYFVNDSPWPASLTLNVALPPGVRPDELSGQRRLPTVAGNRWTLELAPFDFLAVRFSSEKVRLANPRATLPEAARMAVLQRIDDLRQRRSVLENPPPSASLANGDFEQVARRREIPRWSIVTESKHASGVLDSNQSYEGKNSVRLSSDGPFVGLHSEPIPVPASGRLHVSMFLRIENPEEQPTLRLAVEGLGGETEYLPSAYVGAGDGVPLKSDWSQYLLPVEDIPLGEISQLRLRFDLVGAGDVWIDSVEVYDLAFTPEERAQLDKLLALVAFQSQAGRWAECARELDGYWPRFLLSVVPQSEPHVANEPRNQETLPRREKQAARPGMMDRMKGWWKR